MAATIDSLTSATLKHLREDWWNDEFTEFLTETLRPRPGNRILDVGCGEGQAEISIGRLHISQVRLFGVDRVLSKVLEGKQAAAAHNQRVGFAVADACCLSFAGASFDSIYCVAVLQHVRDVDAAVAEFARVTRPNGRVVAVEPDNTARYFFSPTPAGKRAFDLSNRFFHTLAVVRNERPNDPIGPKIPALFARHDIEAIEVRLFPVSHARLGAPSDDVWAERRRVVEAAMSETPEVHDLGRQYLDVLHSYASEARDAGPAFVEIQNTMLFGTVGQRRE
jgi:2-polyprenyl-3-methyl-5-hydroxy-6-metoxy-1,4-benzoquinol methylase